MIVMTLIHKNLLRLNHRSSQKEDDAKDTQWVLIRVHQHQLCAA